MASTSKLFENRAFYLDKISSFVNVPQLKSYYRADRDYNILRRHPTAMQNRQGTCQKCLLDRTETNISCIVKPERKKRILRKYTTKVRFTYCQKKVQNTLAKYKQCVIFKCHTCKHEEKIPIHGKPVSTRAIEIIDTPIEKPRLKKRTRKDRLAGMVAEAVENAQQQMAAVNVETPKIKVWKTDDFIPLDVSAEESPPKKKRKVLDEEPNVTDFISLDVSAEESPLIEKLHVEDEDSDVIILDPVSPKIPVAKKKKNKKKAQSGKAVDTNGNNTNTWNDKQVQAETRMKTMKKEVKEVTVARGKLGSLSTRKEKKKLKHKMNKLKSAIKNIEILNNTAKSALKDFLNGIS